MMTLTVGRKALGVGRTHKAILSAVVLLTLHSLRLTPHAFASGPGTTTGELLKIPVGTRAIGMGEAFTAMADDSSALYWNPAGLGFIERKEATFMHSSLIEGVHYEHMSAVVPGDAYAYGGSLSYLGYGTIDGFNNDGIATGNVRAYSYLLNGGLARQLTSNLSLGVAGEFIHQTLDADSAGTVALNGGALYKVPFHPLSANYKLGFAVQNLGPGLKFVSDRDPLPRKIKWGVAATHMFNKPLNLTMDLTKPNDNISYVNLGSEYWFKDLLALRLGYAGSNDEGKGLRLGFGFKWSGVQVDYAYGGFGDFGATHRIGLTFRWGEKVQQLNAEERKLLREAKAYEHRGEYVQAIMVYNDLLDRRPDNDTFLHSMIGANDTMVHRELKDALAEKPKEDDIPTPEEMALQALDPNQEHVAQASPLSVGADPLGLESLPDATHLDVTPTAITNAVKPAAVPSSPTGPGGGSKKTVAAPVAEPVTSDEPKTDAPVETNIPSTEDLLQGHLDDHKAKVEEPKPIQQEEAPKATQPNEKSPTASPVEPEVTDTPKSKTSQSSFVNDSKGSQGQDPNAPALDPSDIYGN